MNDECGGCSCVYMPIRTLTHKYIKTNLLREIFRLGFGKSLSYMTSPCLGGRCSSVCKRSPFLWWPIHHFPPLAFDQALADTSHRWTVHGWTSPSLFFWHGLSTDGIHNSAYSLELHTRRAEVSLLSLILSHAM